MSDIDVIEPVPVDSRRVVLSTGTVLILQELRARQFFKLLKIITRGAAPVIPNLQVDGNSSVEEWTQQFLAVVMLAIPESEQETLEFIASMIKPEGLIETSPFRRKLSEEEKKINDALWDAIEVDLSNPNLDDLVTIIEAIVKNEGEDLKALGKRLMGMFQLAAKTGQLKQ
jgi:hypothetical protein